MRILVVEDDEAAARGTAMVLKSSGAVVDLADSGEEALGLVRYYDYDIVILDLMLPDMIGSDVVRRMRSSKIAVPIMICSSQTASTQRVQLLSYGADDFITKPFDSLELLERARAIVRRSRGFSDSNVNIGPLTLNVALREARINDTLVHLTGKEYAILELLMIRRGTVLTKDAFLSHLYGGMDEPEVKIIDVFICKLRKKLYSAGAQDIIKTVWGQGYTLCDPQKMQ